MKLRQLEQYYGESLLLASISFLALALINEIGSIACGGKSFDVFVSFQHLRTLAPEENWPAFSVLSGLFLKLWLLLLCNTIFPGSLLLWGIFIGFDNLPLPVYFFMVSSLLQISYYAWEKLRIKPRLLLAHENTRVNLRFCTLSFLCAFSWITFGQSEFTCWRQASLFPLVEKSCGPEVAARFLITALPSLKQERGPFSFGRTSLNLVQAAEESGAYLKTLEYSRQAFGAQCREQVVPALGLSYLSDKTGDEQYWPAIWQALLQAKLSAAELEVLFQRTFGYANAYDYLATKALRMKDYDLADEIINRGIRALESDSADGVKALLFSLYATKLQVLESRGASVQARLQVMRLSRKELQKNIFVLQRKKSLPAALVAARQLQEALSYFQEKERELRLRAQEPLG